MTQVTLILLAQLIHSAMITLSKQQGHLTMSNMQYTTKNNLLQLLLTLILIGFFGLILWNTSPSKVIKGCKEKNAEVLLVQPDYCDVLDKE